MIKLLTAAIGCLMASACAIYGDDSRQDVHAIKTAKSDPLWQNVNASFALIPKSNLQKQAGGYVLAAAVSTLQDKTIDVEPTDKGPYPICPKERFLSQPTASHCSGVLIGLSTILTAGHCLQKRGVKAPQNYYAVFDYEQASTSGGMILKEVHEIERLVDRKQTFPTASGASFTLSDWAIAELKTKVQSRAPVQRRRSGKIGDTEKLYTIGHPTGLPKKVAGLAPHHAEITVNEDSGILQAGLDTFEGNSGGGVFNATTHELEGIVVKGRQDWVKNPKADCATTNKCNQRGANCTAGSYFSDEVVQRVTAIPIDAALKSAGSRRPTQSERGKTKPEEANSRH